MIMQPNQPNQPMQPVQPVSAPVVLPPKKNWFVKHKILTAILVIIVLIIAVNAGKGGSSTTTTNNNKATTVTKSEYAVGEAITINDQTLTVTKVTRNFDTGNEFSTPEPGKEFIVVEVQLENKGDSDMSYNTFDFKVQDSSGVQKSEGFILGVTNELSSGDLAKGGKVTGSLSFIVPKDDAGLKLLFQPSFWSNQIFTFKIKATAHQI